MLAIRGLLKKLLESYNQLFSTTPRMNSTITKGQQHFSLKKWLFYRHSSPSLRKNKGARKQEERQPVPFPNFDSPQKHSSAFRNGETDDEGLIHISGMKALLEAHLLLGEPVDCSKIWANVWIEEEHCLEVVHAEAVKKVAPSSSSSMHILIYLCERKERVLNFLWSICRDATDTKNNNKLREALNHFTRREERLLHLYTVKFIYCVDDNIVLRKLQIGRNDVPHYDLT
mmetsp:Transcript_7997/g.12241  ORF Transcript_7997/g.12241 Transcript_7997/m.12241 type:complete len:229 (+) Transcript_7997:1750-2436(+)